MAFERNDGWQFLKASRPAPAMAEIEWLALSQPAIAGAGNRVRDCAVGYGIMCSIENSP
jgi:hypothetical protein